MTNLKKKNFFIPIQGYPAGGVQEGALKKRTLRVVKTKRMSRKWTQSNKSPKAYVRSSSSSNNKHHKRTHHQNSKVKPLTRDSSKTTRGRELVECTQTITSHPCTTGAGTPTITTVIKGSSSTEDTIVISPMVEGCTTGRIIQVVAVMVGDTSSRSGTKVASNMAVVVAAALPPIHHRRLLSKVQVDRTTPAVVNSIRAAVAAAIIIVAARV